MSAFRGMLLTLLGSLLAACHVGPQVDESNPDVGRQPQGAHVIVELTRQEAGPRTEYQGELLEARDDGLVVLTRKVEQNNSRIVMIPWNRIFGADASELKGVRMRTSYADKRRKASVEKLRIVSRFPQGLSPELTGQLLAHYGQAALDSIE